MPTPSDVNKPDFWEEIYQAGRAGWDLGGPTPALQRLLRGGEHPREVVLPVLTKHEVRGIVTHFAQSQGIGDMPQQRTQRLVDSHPSILCLGCRPHLLVDLLQDTGLDLCLEGRCSRELVFQCLTQQVLHGTGQVRSDRRLWLETRLERHKPLMQLEVVGGIE